MDWQRFAPAFVLRRSSPLIEALPEVAQALAEADAVDASADGAGQALAGGSRACRGSSRTACWSMWCAVRRPRFWGTPRRVTSARAVRSATSVSTR